ncbi:ACP S-malonyltransferase [Naumannella halotolerans]|uniref:[acyl-carrier-protein] S-malonyltransferase n=1 Tax=Naumannella halotolerans TaxID=993414 RepID=A0A4R7J8H8_9ACTN|nr:acyltransferase domain-containing protein [Naumannella halotolerans]TDT33801.1 [acyl-carrier-protein] S-malonyltransferase [Naumannella halotolerans]
MLAIVAPGQGAQKPGFLTPWLADPRFAARLDWLSAVSGLDLRHFGTQADEETIRDTAIAQPLLVAAGLLSAASLFPYPADAFDRIGVVAGHSVGEITAAAGVGVLSAEQAMVLVRERGRAMARASAVRPTSMAAVLRGEPEEVLAAIEAAGLTAANNNGRGQVVAAGTVEQLDRLADNLPPKARLVPLSVAGAFHTAHMSPAVKHLSDLARAVSTHDPRVPLLSNADGQVVGRGSEVLARIVGQVANPVRWDLCLDTMADLGVTGLLEVTPAGTLTGLAKRNLPGVETFALNTPDELDDAATFVRNHADVDPARTATAPAWQLVLSPARGQFERTEGIETETVLSGLTTLGTVQGADDRFTISTPAGGAVGEWLVEDGDPVAPGQPLLRLDPSGRS